MAENVIDARPFPAAMINITNRCTLRCRHCFVFRDANPNDPDDEMDTTTMLKRIRERKDNHGIRSMLWMGGEPLLRKDVLREGVTYFERNTITTNGTIDLIDLDRTMYVVSVDGPPEINDPIRGKDAFKKVMETLERLPDEFKSPVFCQCVVTRQNENHLEDLIPYLRLGGQAGYLISADWKAGRDYEDDLGDEVTGGSLDVALLRKDINFWALAGGGLKYKIPNGYVILDLRYNIGLTDQNDPAYNRYASSDDVQDMIFYYYSTDDNFRLNNAIISLGYQRTFYRPKKYKQ